MIYIPRTGDPHERLAVSLYPTTTETGVSIACQYRAESLGLRRKPSDPEWKTWQDSGLAMYRKEALALRDALTSLLEPEEEDHP